MLELGILLAIFCALGTNISFLARHRGAVAAPPVRFRHPLRSAAGLFRSRWWLIGYAIAAVAWIAHLGALALAPLSLVQVVISGGLVLLVWPAERWFGFKLDRRQWCGIALSAAGLAMLAVTVDAGSAHSSYSLAPMLAFEVGLLSVGALLLLSGTSSRVGPRHGVLLGAGAGILFGVSNVALKALTGTVPGDLLSIVSPWTLSALVAGILAFFALARGLQIGEGISVIAISSVAANSTAILGGILVFGDPMGSGTLEVVLRSLAFAAVIAAAALMPGPLRAGRLAT